MFRSKLNKFKALSWRIWTTYYRKRKLNLIIGKENQFATTATNLNLYPWTRKSKIEVNNRFQLRPALITEQ